jgi:superfamily II DNA helicase RecQ
LRVSQQWHRIAGLGDGPPPALPPEPDIDSSISAVVAAPAAVFDSATAASTEHLHAALVDHTLNCTADFWSDAQRQALGELVQRDTDNAIVLPTGSGKSFLYMLLARKPRLGVTVVILPLVALLHDVVARCRTEQVPYTTWADMNRGSTQPVMGASAPLVFATVEQAVQWRFCSWATRLKVARQLHRVIVDGAHLQLTASNYRPVLRRLRDLRAVSCPWSVMSATLPIVSMQELGHLLLMPNIQYVRQSANRLKLAYRVIHLGRNESMAAAVKEVLRRK